ncbi:MAG: sensor histidine kinase, partial [Candidatus Dormibacteraeota bacterium]|nr:sensor histidine kinase [Candidatus Dormibacteraeota bacterium]
LQNVQKYAQAQGATVRVYERDNILSFQVKDDGVGFNPTHNGRGSGTQNMADRLDALDGTFDLSSTPGGGTTVSGSLPVSGAVLTPAATES